MYSNNNIGSNKQTSFENTITVTPIKVELDMSHSYPTPGTSGSSVAMAATTSSRRGTPANSVSITNITTSNYVGTPSRNAGALPKEKAPKTTRPPVPRKPPPTIDTFWPTIMTEVRNIQQVDAKHQSLPLARIKKIMKLDESAKMIAAEAPLLFAKASEYFIQELTMRAWIHTEESKRRTLQRSDIAQAIANYDQFDFLIDIVPREDIKPPPANHKKETNSSSTNSGSTNNNTTVNNVPAAPTATVTLPTGNVDVKLDQEILQFTSLTPETITINAPGQPTQTLQALPQQQQLQIIQQTAAATAQPQQLQYFITIPGVGQQANAQPQIVQQLHMPQQQLNNSLTPQLTSLNLVAAHHQPQQLILTAGPNGQLTATPATTAAQQTLAAAQQHQQQQQQQQQNQQQQQQQIQLMQQVMTPNGELTNVPITINANQLNLLRLQMQQQQQPQQQQVLIPTQCLTTQPLLQLGTVNATVANHNPQMIQQHQQPQQQQHIQQQQQQHHHHQQQQQQHNANDNASIFINPPQANSQATTTTTTNAASIVSTDRNLGSTYRPNC